MNETNSFANSKSMNKSASNLFANSKPKLDLIVKHRQKRL